MDWGESNTPSSFNAPFTASTSPFIIAANIVAATRPRPVEALRRGSLAT
jgi:hypothetical protein